MLRRVASVGEEGTCLISSKACDGYLLSAETRLTSRDKEAGDSVISTEPLTGSVRREFLHGVWHQEVEDHKYTMSSDFVTLSAGGKAFTCEIVDGLTADMNRERASAAILGIPDFMVRFSHLEPSLKKRFKQKLEELEERKTNAADAVARLKAEEAVARLKLSLFFIAALDDTGKLLCKWYQYNDEEQSVCGGLVGKFECGGSGETKAEPLMRDLWNKGKTMKRLVVDHQKAMEEACKEIGVGGTHYFIKVQKLDGKFYAVKDNLPLFEPFRIVKLKDDDRENLEHPITSLPLLEEEIKNALARRGINIISPIQSLVLELLKDTGSLGILGRVKTGTWKTLGFGIQIMNRILKRKEKKKDASQRGTSPLALVFVPTLQLGREVETQFRATSTSLVITCLNYDHVNKMIRSLTPKNVDIIIGIPDGIEHMLNMKSEENKLPELNLSEVLFSVFVEADDILERFDKSLLQVIFLRIHPSCKNVIFAKATMAPGIRELADEWLRNPIAVDLQHDLQGAELGRPVQDGHWGGGGGLSGGSSSGYGIGGDYPTRGSGCVAMYGKPASSSGTETRSPSCWYTESGHAESSPGEAYGQTPPLSSTQTRSILSAPMQSGYGPPSALAPPLSGYAQPDSAQYRTPSKVNPFGDAKPTEMVLPERERERASDRPGSGAGGVVLYPDQRPPSQSGRSEWARPVLGLVELLHNEPSSGAGRVVGYPYQRPASQSGRNVGGSGGLRWWKLLQLW